MDENQKSDIVKRLGRLEGQVRGVINMINDDRYCIDILNQTKAIKSALERVDSLIVEQHLNSCVVNAIESGNQDDKEKKITEIVNLFSRYRS